MINKPTFSIVLIAKNESKTLPRLVNSLKEFQQRQGEIILLDTNSTDDTANIARSLGCIVYEVGNKFRITIDKTLADNINNRFIVDKEEPVVKSGDSMFDYSSARNYIAQFASNDMIATPDCDEIWTKFDIDKIQEYISQGAEQFEYNFVFAHDDSGKPLVQFMHSKFYNRTKLKWVGVIHEVLSGSAKMVFLDESIVKLEHFQNVETNRSGYLKGLAYDCFLNPDADRNSHYFARECMYTGRYKTAIKEFTRHISMNKWHTERAQSMLFIGDCYYYLGNKDESSKWYLKSFDSEPHRREPLLKLAEQAHRENKPVQVIVFCIAALELPGVNFYANYQPYYTYIPHELLYWAYWWIGNKEKSKIHFDIAFQMCPTNPKFINERSFYYPDASELQFTGERLVPGKTDHRPDIIQEHIARYNFAAQFTKGMTVIDAACGTGYAKEILQAKGYLGVDISQEAINYASKHYSTGFLVADLENPQESVSPVPVVDIIISFETIEHLESPHNFLKWVSENSKLFIFSIPVNMPSEFHKQVYSVEQIKNLIDQYFPECVYFSQNDDQIISLDGNPKYIVGVASIQKLPSIDIIIPQLGREEGLKKCIQSIKESNYPIENITYSVIDGEETVPIKLRTGVETTDGDYICYAANDMIFEPNTLLIAAIQSILLDKGLVSFNEGPLLEDQGNICTHFIIKRALISQIGGDIFDTKFTHAGVDNLLWAKCSKLNQTHYSQEAKIIHNHFSKGFEYDDIYQKGWKNIEQDRELLKKELLLLNL